MSPETALHVLRRIIESWAPRGGSGVAGAGQGPQGPSTAGVRGMCRDPRGGSGGACRSRAPRLGGLVWRAPLSRRRSRLCPSVRLGDTPVLPALHHGRAASPAHGLARLVLAL